MGKEIEAKMEVFDLDAIRRLLWQARAERVKAELETNTFFDTKDESLLKSDTGLRIRVATDEAGAQRCVVTLKGPHEKGPFKKREEIEFTADDPEAARAVFEHLGFRVALSFQKRRETWNLGSCEVVLDELPHLGTFVEIEGESEGEIEEVRELLHLDGAPAIQTGYAEMIARYLRDRGIEDRSVIF
jgi:adenylate cyclase, class 2